MDLTNTSVISLSNLLERWAVRRDEVRLIAGHFSLSTVELLDADFVTLSVLRPPVERTLSYLRHQQKLNAADRERSFEEIYDDPVRYNGLIRNHMTRSFSIGTDEMGPGDGVLTDVPDTSERLERAKAGVASLDAFGIQPCFEDFWGSLAATVRPGARHTAALQHDRPRAAALIGPRPAHRAGQRPRSRALRLRRGPLSGAARMTDTAVLDPASEALEGDDWRAAIELLEGANRLGRDDQLEIALAALRHRAHAPLVRETTAGSPPAPSASPPVGDRGLPEAALSSLDAAQLARRAAGTRLPVRPPRARAGALRRARRGHRSSLRGPGSRARRLRRRVVVGATGAGARSRNGAGAEVGAWWRRRAARRLASAHGRGARPLHRRGVARPRRRRTSVPGPSCPPTSARCVGSRRRATGTGTRTERSSVAAIRALNLWVTLTPCGADAPGLDLVPRRFDGIVETGTGGAYFDWAVGPDVVESAAGQAGVLRPEFEAGDLLIFDDLFLHRTAVAPEMRHDRHAIEMW